VVREPCLALLLATPTLILISLFLMPETPHISIWKEAKTAKAPA
jgi:hypothetical protein